MKILFAVLCLVFLLSLGGCATDGVGVSVGYGANGWTVGGTYRPTYGGGK